ncbi:MAG: hypothetical protein JNJ54_21565 [Myxococcaceae bacterium]|nr:hypothetical protein [Myxococcaceae bacterium]
MDEAEVLPLLVGEGALLGTAPIDMGDDFRSEALSLLSSSRPAGARRRRSLGEGQLVLGPTVLLAPAHIDQRSSAELMATNDGEAQTPGFCC